MIAEFVSDLISPRARTVARPSNNLENPAINLNDPDTWDSLLSGTRTDAGVKVSHQGAVALPAVMQAVQVISGDVACATLMPYKRDLETDHGTRDYTHWTYHYVACQANELTPAFQLWRRAMVHVLIWGNAWIWIDRPFGRLNPRSEIEGLYNLMPDRTYPMLDPSYSEGYKIVTEVTNYDVPQLPGQRETELKEFDPRSVLHIAGVGYDTVMGIDMTAAARESWGLALAAEGFLSKFFGRGAQTGGILEVPVTMSPKAQAGVVEGWRKREGSDNWFKTAILRDGAKFHSVTVDPQSSEMHLVREDQVRDTARFFNLHPSKLGLSDSVSYNSQEQSQKDHVSSCLHPWFKAISSECDIKLLTPRNLRGRLQYFSHDTAELVTPDIQTQTEVLSKQIEATIINPNEARRVLKRPPRPGGEEYGNPNTSSPHDDRPEDDPPEDDEAEYDEPDEGDEETDEDEEVEQQIARAESASAVYDSRTAAIESVVREQITRASNAITKYVKQLSKKPEKLEAWATDPAKSADKFDEICETSCELLDAHLGVDRTLENLRTEYLAALIDQCRAPFAYDADKITAIESFHDLHVPDMLNGWMDGYFRNGEPT